MNWEVTTEELINQPDVYLERYQKYSYLNDKFLKTGRPSLEYDNVEYYLESDDYPRSLDSYLISLIEDFLGYQPPESDYTINEDKLAQLIDLRNVLGEQLAYLSNDDRDSCTVYRIYAKINGKDYGEVYYFHNQFDHPEWAVIQGIARSLESGLTAIFLPQIKYPSLNRLLDPEIVKLSQELKVTEIFVYPLYKQGEILKKYYSYQKTDRLFYPSVYILGSTEYPIDHPPSNRLVRHVF